MSNFSSNNYNPFKKVNSNQNNIESGHVEINKTNIKNKVPLQLKMNKNIIQDDNTDNNLTKNLKEINKNERTNFKNNKINNNSVSRNEILQNEDNENEFNHSNCYNMYSPEKKLELDEMNININFDFSEKKIENKLFDDYYDNNFDYGNDYEEMQKIASICNKEISFDDL
jgi:hypothetical protein